MISCINLILGHYQQSKIAPKRILLFSHELSLTGAPIALFNMAKTLKSQGFDLTIISLSGGNLEDEIRKNNINCIIDADLSAKIYQSDKEVQNFFASFDVVLFNTIITLQFAQYIKTDNRKIGWVHEGEIAYKYAEQAFDVIHAFSYVDLIYSVGNYSKSFTDKYIPQEKSAILLYGVDAINSDYPAAKSDKCTFGIFGSICMRKGTDLFVDAVKQLPDDVKKHCIFKIIGRTEDEQFYAQIKKQAETENIILVGQLSHQNTLQEMAQTDIIVCPSRDDPMPIVCTEASQLGKTVICSDHTGTAEFIKDGINAYIYRLNQDNLKDIMLKAYNNQKHLRAMGKKWHKVYAENFTSKIFAKNIMRIFKTCSQN